MRGLNLIAVFVEIEMPQAAVAWLRVNMALFALVCDSLGRTDPSVKTSSTDSRNPVAYSAVARCSRNAKANSGRRL
jgi:hypothetical protein